MRYLDDEEFRMQKMNELPTREDREREAKRSWASSPHPPKQFRNYDIETEDPEHGELQHD